MSDDPDLATTRATNRRFGQRLQAERQAAGISQEALATAVGLSRSSIANIERGSQAVSLHLLYRLAEALDCEPAQLLPSQPTDVDPDLDPELVRGFEGSETASRWITRVATSSDAE